MYPAVMICRVRRVDPIIPGSLHVREVGEPLATTGRFAYLNCNT